MSSPDEMELAAIAAAIALLPESNEPPAQLKGSAWARAARLESVGLDGAE